MESFDKNDKISDAHPPHIKNIFNTDNDYNSEETGLTGLTASLHADDCYAKTMVDILKL